MRAYQIERAHQPLSSSGVPTEILEKASTRLTSLAFLYACTSLFMHFLFTAVRPEIISQGRFHEISQYAIWGSVGLSVLLIAILRSGYLSPIVQVRLGLGYTVATAFSLGIVQFCSPLSNNSADGASYVAVWIAICGLTVPNTLRASALTNFAAALSHPLAYVVSLHLHGHTPLPPGVAALLFMPTFILAGWTTLLNNRMYRMVKEVAQARQIGSYRLDSLIAKGGMGEVWRGSHAMLARDAAVKLIRPEMLLAQTGRQASLVRKRFEQEARSTAALRSPHTVELYDFGVSADGSFYYVMELLDGLDLENLVKLHGPLSPSRVVHILKQACHSLAEAHELGLVHRDIKPTNIYLTKLGIECDFVKILDFGLVKRSVADEESRMTVQGTTTGTPAFMPPEVARGDAKVDGRADLYALGCVAYWLLTGCLVFPEKSAVAIILAHLQTPPPPPSSRIELPIPAEVEQLVLSCLAKDPKDRPESAVELLDRLEKLPNIRLWSAHQAADWWSMHQPSSKDAASHGTKASIAATV
jgi:eukaryotic-like serine/threonine-protein kinase